MKPTGRTYYLLALLAGLVLHASIMFFTFEKTYDAYVHMFFAEHYSSSWFENWNYKWYTGFTITSYPPLVHQIIAVFSMLVGLKFGFYLWGIIVVLIFIRGVYHFSRLWVNDISASYAAILAVVSSSFVEALHVFGQLPSVTGIAFLLNACPEIYKWARNKSKFRLFTSLCLIAVISSAHHVTTIFGMVFFVLPVLGLALMDNAIAKKGEVSDVRLLDFIQEVKRNFFRFVGFGISVIAITLTFIFAYWYWSKTDPISQVSIPHGSRDNFLEVYSSGLVFFLIPWSIMLFFLPYFFIHVFKKRNVFLGISFTLAFILGTGGTTPIAKMILGQTAFEILTLDRFTYWASIMILPFFGALVHSMISGEIFQKTSKHFNILIARFNAFLLLVGIILSTAFIVNISYFRPLQPDPIDIDPIVNFLERDNHENWRYMTLGFGDQMAWLSANTDALSVDGNYHSVRRLPELTTRSVERLENAKYRGIPGIGALQQFLTVPEKYNLKYIFNNDKFYVPLLHFAGWKRVQELENNIIVWENPDVIPLPKILPRKEIPKLQRLMWGILPLTSLFLIAVCYFLYWFKFRKKEISNINQEPNIEILKNYSMGKAWKLIPFFFLITFFLTSFSFIRIYQKTSPSFSPENVLTSYYDALDFKKFNTAHSYIDPNQNISMEQFLLEQSLEDGILASYAKLSSIEFDFIAKEKEHAQVNVHSKWISSLESYSFDEMFNLVRRGNKWFIQHKDYEKRIAPDQFFNIPVLDFKNQGSRRAISGESNREDELDRPEVYIQSARLIHLAGDYNIVGEITNVDNEPAYITLEAVLYDQKGEEIIKYNVRDIVKHNILPKESTAFRLDFAEAFTQILAIDSTQKILKPKSFALFVKTMSSDFDFYPFTGVHSVRTIDDNVRGEIVNYGTKEISVPQVLHSYYNTDGALVWVDKLYLSSGIRPHKQKLFQFAIPDLSKMQILSIGNDENLIVNGISRSVSKPSKLYNTPVLLSINEYKINIELNPLVSNTQ